METCGKSEADGHTKFVRKEEQTKNGLKSMGLPISPRLQYCPNLVAFGLYSAKPVHFLSMSCTSLKCVEKFKVVFDKKAENRIQMRFL
jgi:hypothetical protein